MEVILTVTWILTLLIRFAKADVPKYTEKYFEQTLDHFNFYLKLYGKDTYQQRYLVQDKWWKKGNGPIFFYTGNEGNIESFWNNTGLIFELAPKYEALIIFAEHRFYGKSMPFGEDQSFLHPYVDLLTAEQAMADFATLIYHQRAALDAADCPVIAFGGSYGGMLAAYMRYHYPHLVAGSIAASAPVRLVAGQSDSHGYWKTVTKDYHDAMPGCDNQVRRAYQQMTQLSKKGDIGLKHLTSQFNLCSPITNVKQYHHLVKWTINAFGTTAMMDYPYPTSFMSPLPGNPVKVQCNRLLGATTPLDGLSHAVALFYGDGVKCNDIYTDFIDCADPTGCGSGLDSKAWDYQSCTEFRMPTGTNNVTDMFPEEVHDTPWLLDYCAKTWQVKPRYDWAAISFWGKDVQAASNIVFSNGLLDPWYNGGILNNASETVVAVLIEGGAHHLDLRTSNPADPPSVRAARLLEEDHIRRWIREARSTRNSAQIKPILSEREELKYLLQRWMKEEDTD